MEWEPHMLLHKVLQELKGDLVTDIIVKHLRQDIQVTNEMLDLLASLKIPKAGLNSIVFYYWYRMEDALDSAVFERLIAKTKNLKMLVVY